MLQRTGEGDALRWLIAVPTEDGKVTIVGNRVASVRFVGADLTVLMADPVHKLIRTNLALMTTKPVRAPGRADSIPSTGAQILTSR